VVHPYLLFALTVSNFILQQSQHLPLCIETEQIAINAIVLSFEKYAPKLQNLCDIKKRNAKKVTKKSENSFLMGIMT